MATQIQTTDIKNAAVTPAKADLTQAWAFTNDVSVSGNLTVTGTTVTVSSETQLLSDNHLSVNHGYTADAAQTGGMVVNYDPTTTATTVNGSYVAGVAATSNPTVVTTGSATFAVADLIQISGGASPKNSGLYEVLSHVSTILTIRGIGTTAAVEDFTQNQFVAGASDGASITKVNVSVLRAGTDGIWESGKGSATPLTFTNVADVSGAGASTLQQAYESGNTVTTSAGEGNVTINGTEDLIIGGSVDITYSTSGALNQTGTGQVTFAGNVNANLGLDVSGAALTVANQAITQTTGGQVTFAGNVDATSGLDVTGADLTIPDTLSLVLGTAGTGADADLYWNGVSEKLVVETAGVTRLEVTQAGAVAVKFADSNANALVLEDSAGDNYLKVVTTAAAEEIELGNTVTNPQTTFLGSGAVHVTGSTDLNSTLTVADNITLDKAGAQTITHTNAGGLTISSTGNVTIESVVFNGQAVSNASTIDGSGDLTMGTITMTGFSVDSSGNATALSAAIGGGYGSTGATLSSTGNLQMNGNLTVDGTSTLTGNVDASAGVDVLAGSLTLADNLNLVLGTDSDWTLKYDETTDDALELVGAASTVSGDVGTSFTISGSAGGIGTAAVAPTAAGAGGPLAYTAGAGGAGAGTNAAGEAGGDAGAGGAVSLTAGIGGAGAVGTVDPAHPGVGGALTFVAGAGGAGAGTSNNANGGTITLNAGAPGAGGSGSAGVAGSIILGGTRAAALNFGNATDNTTLTQTGTGQVTFAGNVDANAGLDVSGAALTVANQAITQTTGGQVTFAGNVDANAGLDVSGAALTIANQAITQTTGGQVTFAGNVDANNGLDVAGAGVTVASGLNITMAGASLLTVGTTGITAVSGSRLDLGSTTVAPKLTSVTTTQRDALTAVDGMLVFNSTTDQFESYDGAWTRIGGAVPAFDVVSKFTGDGVTLNFDLAHSDADGNEYALLVTKNGLVMELGGAADFTFSDNGGAGGADRITFVSAPENSSRILVRYRRTSI